VRAPLLAAFLDLSKLKLVSDALDFELPLLLADIGLNHGVRSMICLHLARQVRLNLTAAKVQVFVDVVAAFLRVDLVGKVSIALHVISFLGILVAALTLLANHRFLELEASR